MKFTTAIALTAFLGNAAFSNALDVCNPDGGYTAPCNKVCQRPETEIRNQVKIQCKVDLDGDGKLEDCFDPDVSAGECRDVEVTIQYKYMNTNDNLELVSLVGSYPDKDFSWMAFGGSQVLEQTQNLKLLGNESKKFNIVRTINTCNEYLVEIKSKMPVPDDVKTSIWTALPSAPGVYYNLKQRFCDKQYVVPSEENDFCKENQLNGQKDLDLSTDKCGVSGKILLCDTECEAAWDAAKGGDQAPEPGPSDPTPPAPKPPSDTDPSNPSPSSPSKGGTKAPSAGKGTKQPTIGKGKGTPLPGRKLKNRKVARV